MSVVHWKGVYPAVLTPFNKDETIDFAMLKINLEAQLDAGVDGIVLGGSLGEASTLESNEKAELLAYTKIVAKAMVPVIMNIAEQSTRQAIRAANEAEQHGADGLMLLPPMRYKADERETVAFFKDIAANTSLPIMIYNNPVDYKIMVTLDMFEELAEVPNIQAVKESTRDVSNVTRMINRFGDRFKILCGVDPLAMESLCMGADGWVAGLVDAFPRETVAIYRLVKAGYYQEALKIYRWFLPVLELDIHPKLVQYIKLAAASTEISTEHVRAPRLPLIGKEREQVLAVIDDALKPVPCCRIISIYNQPKMFSGHNYIGFTDSAEGSQTVKVFSTVQQDFLPEAFTLATGGEMEAALEKAKAAFHRYKKTTPEARAVFLETIAEEIGAIGDVLVQRAMLETGLPEGRLVGERGRTVNQLKLFAALLREGSWVDTVIDTAQPGRKPVPRPDLRKMLCPLGPVVVFGASNFPFAFSTAGGDTASALAAGCPVILKAHSSHLGTNELVTKALITAAVKCGMPDGVFSSLIGEGSKLGQALAKHPYVKAIGFTGSYKAGMALYKTAVNDRETPIPVYAEMSSINPVLLLPKKLENEGEKVASQLAGSITLGVGQFCTNPGLLFAINSAATDTFIKQLAAQLEAIPEAVMLNATICQSYYAERKNIVGAKGVKPLLIGKDDSAAYKGSPALMAVSATDFIQNGALQNEIFGPASLLVTCADEAELLEAVQSLHGQLTGTVFGTEEDTATYAAPVEALAEKVGRLIYNSVPTGVEVGHAMVHGGPYPATTDGRTTSVGADAIKRFVRPVCFQDCPDALLPEALKDSNPLGLMRKVDGQYTKAPVRQLQEA